MNTLSLWVFVTSVMALLGGLWVISEVLGRVTDDERYSTPLLLIATACLVTILGLFTLPAIQLSINTLCL